MREATAADHRVWIGRPSLRARRPAAADRDGGKLLFCLTYRTHRGLAEERILC